MNRDILRLALPSIVSNITVPLLGLADVTIMGHMGEARFIGAIAVGSMIFNMVYWLFGFLRMGTSGLTAQAYGREETTMPLLKKSLGIALLFGLLIVLLQWPLREFSLWVMEPSAEVRELVIPYYNICVWGAPAVLGLFALNGWYVGMQNTRIPMFIAVAQNIINIVASVLFVFGFGMGIEGAALGTMIAQWFGFLVAFFLLPSRTGLFFSDASSSSNASASSVGAGFSSGVSISGSFGELGHDFFFLFLRTLCLVAVNTYFTAAGAQQGTLILAANTLLMQLFTIFSYFMDGFANAGEALAGRYYGAQDRENLSKVIRYLFGWGGGMIVLFSLLYGVGGTAFLHLLTNDATVVEMAGDYLPWAVLIPLCGMVAFIWDGIFIGITATRGMLISCFVAAVAFFAVWFGLHALWGNHALWLALLTFLFLRGAVQTVLYRLRLTVRKFLKVLVVIFISLLGFVSYSC